MDNIIEYLRKCIIEQLQETGFSQMFPIWKEKIDQLISGKTEMQILNLGDHLSEIFLTTGTSGRDQGSLSGGGAAWEAFVCWYLNLCLAGRRTVVIKHNKRFMPAPVSHAITVNYNNFQSNSESDLIGITFPDKMEYKVPMTDIDITDINGDKVSPVISRRTGSTEYNLLPVLNALAHRDFGELEIHIIQCKTNWNDNSQIPMLWDAVYAADTFTNGIVVGTNGYSMHDVKRFTYSFVTVPTNKIDLFRQNSTAVLRVRHLSGGNYWGRPTKQGIANSLKEMIERNLKSGSPEGILVTLRKTASELDGKYSYFGI